MFFVLPVFPVQLLIEASKTAGTQAKKKARMARFWFDRTLNQQMQLYDVMFTRPLCIQTTELASNTWALCA